MKKIATTALLATSLFTGTTQASIDDVSVSANVTGVSKYIWRGYDLNDNFTIQGGFDLSYNGFYAGVWGGDDQSSGNEIDLYAGYGFNMTDNLAFEIGYLQYRYEETDSTLDEWHVTGTWYGVGLTFHDGESGYQYAELNYSLNLTDKLSAALHAGYEKTGEKYYDLMTTLSYAINSNYTVFLALSEKEDFDTEFAFGITGTF